jgi:hypothetical protein
VEEQRSQFLFDACLSRTEKDSEFAFSRGGGADEKGA